MLVNHCGAFIVYNFDSVDHSAFLILINVKITDSSSGIDLKSLLLIHLVSSLELRLSGVLRLEQWTLQSISE